jgi:hypothetical protein
MNNMPVKPGICPGGRASRLAGYLLSLAGRARGNSHQRISTATRPISRFSTALALLLAVFLLLPQNAFAQKGNKPPGRNGKPGGTMKEEGRDRREYELAALLPSGFQHLRTAEVRQLEQLSRKTLTVLRSAAISPDIFPHPSQLLQIRPAASANPDDAGGENLANPEIRGLRVLSLLEQEQRRTLAAILDDYRRDSDAWQEQADQLITVLVALCENPAPAAFRKLDADTRRPLGELAKLDADLALLQVRTFLKIAKSLRPKQSEAISLAIVSSAVLENNTPEMQEVQELLGKTTPEAARDLKYIALNFGSWLLPPAMAASDAVTPAGNDPERRGGGRDRTVDPALLEFLTVLRGPQHQLLLSMLTTATQQDEQSAVAQAAIQTALRPSSSSPVVDERNLRGLFQQRNRLLFTATADDIRAAESFRQALSDIQKEHLGITAAQKKKKPQGAQ